MFQFDRMTMRRCVALSGRQTMWPTGVARVACRHACRFARTVFWRLTTWAMTLTCSGVRPVEHVTVVTPVS